MKQQTEDPEHGLYLAVAELLKSVQSRLDVIEGRVADLKDPDCQKCGRSSANPVQLVGGYEAVLCRACRNAWQAAVLASDHWINYRKACVTSKAVVAALKAGIRAGRPLSPQEAGDSVSLSVGEQVAAERMLFRFAMQWIAGGSP